MQPAISKSDSLLGAWAAEGVDSENGPQRGQFLPDSQAHSPAMGQEAGEKWTAAAYLQPTLLLPPTLLAQQGGRPLYHGPLQLLAGPHRIEAGW